MIILVLFLIRCGVILKFKKRRSRKCVWGIFGLLTLSYLLVGVGRAFEVLILERESRWVMLRSWSSALLRAVRSVRRDSGRLVGDVVVGKALAHDGGLGVGLDPLASQVVAVIAVSVPAALV